MPAPRGPAECHLRCVHPVVAAVPYDLEALTADVIMRLTGPTRSSPTAKTARHLPPSGQSTSPTRLPGRCQPARPMPHTWPSAWRARPPADRSSPSTPGGPGWTRSQAPRQCGRSNKIAANSIQHGGGHGELRAWTESRLLVCEVSDHGHSPHRWLAACHRLLLRRPEPGCGLPTNSAISCRSAPIPVAPPSASTRPADSPRTDRAPGPCGCTRQSMTTGRSSPR